MRVGAMLVVLTPVVAVQKPDLAKMGKVLESIDHGLHSLLGHSKIPDGTQVMVEKVDHAIAELKQANATDADKAKEAAKVMGDLKVWQTQLTKKQEELAEEAKQEDSKMENYHQKDRNTMLFNELLPLQDSPVEEQLAVLRKPIYSTLPVVKALLANRTEEENVAYLVGEFLDEDKERKAQEKKAALAKMSPQDRALAPILDQLQHRVEAVEDALADMSAQEKKLAASDKQLTSTSNLLSNEAKKGAIEEAAKMLKMVRRREKHQIAKARATKQAELNALKTAIDAVKKHNLAGVQKAMSELNNMGDQQQDFLH